MNDLEGSIAAYKTALKYDPENAASKSYLSKAQLKLERQQQEDGSINVSNEARRLMADTDMMNMAKKMMNGSAASEQDLLADPEMKKIARKAMTDPTMLEVIKNIHRIDRNSVTPSS